MNDITKIIDRVRTDVDWGRDKFYSLFRKPNATTGKFQSKERGYSELRGLFVPKKRGIPGFDESRKFLFQFNPAEVTVDKEAAYNPRIYSGLDFNDYIWANGGAKTISFSLFMDCTPGSYYDYFRKTDGTSFSIYNEIETLKPRKLADEMELLESFLHPEIPKNGTIKVPQFTSGGVVIPNQFYPPPVLIFVYGEFYLEGFLSSCSTKVTLFDEFLRPVRAEADIVFTVFERNEVKQNEALKTVKPKK